MWKDDYLIGVEIIDIQHQSLFAKVAELADMVEAGVDKNKQQIINSIMFLKKYALQHFSDEEAYQKSIRYKDFEEHQAQHKSFIKVVLQHERKLKDSDFAEEEVQGFMHTLTTWVVFHVANSDQKIVGKSVSV